MIKTEAKNRIRPLYEEWTYPILLYSKIYEKGKLVVLALNSKQAISLVNEYSVAKLLGDKDGNSFLPGTNWVPYDGEVVISND